MVHAGTMSPEAARPLVSVVVGVLNGAKTLERCIDSVVEQSLQDHELIVKDGVSTDGTLEILERRTSDIAFWASAPDTGLYDAWNSVLDRCRGEWICFLGCDDEFAERTSLETLTAPARLPDPPDLICALVALTESSGKFVRTIGRPWNWGEMKRANRIAHPGALHRARLFEQHGKFDTSLRIAGDYDFLLRLGKNARAEFVDQIIVRMGANGMSDRLIRRSLVEQWRVQAAHPEIGRGDATVNLGIGVAKALARRALGMR